MLFSLLRALGLIAGSLVYLVCAGEILCRFTDGYAFDQVTLTERPQAAHGSNDGHGDGRDAERSLLEHTWIDRTIDPNLFFTPPVEFRKPTLSELQQRSSDNPNILGQENYLWNDAFLKEAPADTRKTISEQRSATIFAFSSYDGTQFPRFRLYPNAHTTLGTTNQFGWLSPDISVKKPAGVVRIGILGDSTSHNAYALYLQALLQAWAAKSHPGLRFEMVNTARQGLGIQDNINILKYELAPTSPDYAILTQAPGVLFGGHTLWTAKAGVDTSVPSLGPSWFGRQARGVLRRYEDRSALARHFIGVIDGTLPDSVEHEPRKPLVRLVAPLNMTSTPSLEQARTSSYFNFYLNELDLFAKISRDDGIIPIITTERACAFPGMTLSPKVNPYLFSSANSATYWPLTYKQIQHILWFDNSVIKKWSAQNGVLEIDLQGMLPKQTALCTDLMHDTPLSQRLRAWLIFQSLAPVIDGDVANGRVPHLHDNGDTDFQVAFGRPMIVLDRENFAADFKSAPAN
jgi:hypothetical protein